MTRDENRRDDMSDSALVERLKQGDKAAFAHLFEKHRRGVLAYVRGLCGDTGTAEDITQDCFVALARRADSIDPRRGVSGWLYRTARNRTIDVLRRRRFTVLPGDDYFEDESRPEATDQQPGPVEELAAKERRESVEQALAALPVEQRELLVMRFYAGLTFREMAEILGRPIGTVLWQTRRSLERLSKHAELRRGAEDFT